jgi:Fe-S oxidoreductase
MAYLHELVRDCLQDEPAFCAVKCPFNLDVRDFTGKLQQGRYNAAYKAYQSTVGFPGIVSALCPEPCKDVCAMKENGGSVSMRLLEAASINFARNRDPDQYNMPLKPARIAIIGAGPGGLACALRLATRKYNVTVFEKTGSIGGHLNDLPDADICSDDIRLQFRHEIIDFRLNTEVTDISTLDFDAVYVATGLNGNTFGLSLTSAGPYSTDCNGVFMGGSVTGSGTMEAIAQGLNAFSAIEGFLKTGQMNHVEPLVTETKLTYEAINVIPREAVSPENEKGYSKEETRAEANRCLRCTCDACVRHSPLLGYFRKFPKKITEEVEISINPSSLDGEATLATRLISTCNYCGLCREVCPKDIDTGEFLLRSHYAMREKGKMPWVFHEFFLRDMEFSTGEASLLIMPREHGEVRFLFFPGCQIGASDPRLVTRSYDFLLKNNPATALMLGCCGAPADWAGNAQAHEEVLTKIRTVWNNLGNPTIVFACAMCSQMFKRHLPEINGVFIYNLIAGSSVIPALRGNKSVSVFDPCAARYEDELQRSIRSITSGAGFKIEPLPMEGRLAECCSYGGQVSVAHPPCADYTVKKIITRNSNPYITYCSNCRDTFARAGKETMHILDVVFGLEQKPQPTVSERRENRLLLRAMLLREYCNDDFKMEMKESKLKVPSGLKEKLDRSMTLESDILTLIETCEQSGNKLLDPEKGSFTGHLQIGNMTFWAEYRIMDDGCYELINCYSHRMRIEE